MYSVFTNSVITPCLAVSHLLSFLPVLFMLAVTPAGQQQMLNNNSLKPYLPFKKKMPIFIYFDEDKHTSYNSTNNNGDLRSDRFSISSTWFKISWTGVKIHTYSIGSFLNLIINRLFKNYIILQIAFIFYSKCFRQHCWLSWKSRT